jgi:hypothetical protein
VAEDKQPLPDQRHLGEWELELLHADRPRDLHNWEADLLEKWRQFSHESYAASFMTLAPDVVENFARWLKGQPPVHD